MRVKFPRTESLGSIDQLPHLSRCAFPKFRCYGGKIQKVGGAHGWEQLHRLRQLAAQSGAPGGGFRRVRFVAEIEIRAGGCEWPLRVMLGLGGLLLATPGGGIMPYDNLTMELMALAVLAPTVAVALMLVRRRPVLA